MRKGYLHQESALEADQAPYRRVVKAGEGWMYPVKKGEKLRIVDLLGNQAVDTLFYSLEDVQERYSALDTIQRQGNVYLTTGTELISNTGRVMARIVADVCGRHDTLGGACAAESNSVRYPLEKRYMHSCRDTFLKMLREYDPQMTKRDIPCNINFFMNVPVDPQGGSKFADGLSGVGKYVEVEAVMDLLCLISNCPQLNNPCNGYNPTPIEVLIWR